MSILLGLWVVCGSAACGMALAAIWVRLDQLDARIRSLENQEEGTHGG
jgi:hypothetical protein